MAYKIGFFRSSDHASNTKYKHNDSFVAGHMSRLAFALINHSCQLQINSSNKAS
jgi:hypothetical protein